MVVKSRKLLSAKSGNQFEKSFVNIENKRKTVVNIMTSITIEMK